MSPQTWYALLHNKESSLEGGGLRVWLCWATVKLWTLTGFIHLRPQMPRPHIQRESTFICQQSVCLHTAKIQ